jgi:hypothetical protein
MLRAFSMFGFGGVFLAMSPHLRQQCTGVIGSGAFVMEAYSPFSYIAGGILVLMFLMISFNRGSQVR